MSGCRTIDITYSHDTATAMPRYVTNQDVRRIAADVRRQIGCSGTGSERITSEQLLGIDALRANGLGVDLLWSVEHPVTDQSGAPVLGVCEYDHRGLPGTALISVNPEAASAGTGLMLGTLAHELGHAIFDAPAWMIGHRQAGLPGLFGDDVKRVYRLVTPDEAHLTNAGGRLQKPDFREWRANEFMGALLVPYDRLAARMRYQASRLRIPLERARAPDMLAPAGAGRDIRLASHMAPGRYDLSLTLLLAELAEDFAVSIRFICIRMVRYGLATPAQLSIE